MGQFSWIDCVNNKRAILDDERVDSYVLVPEEFKNKYGDHKSGHILETCYDGYGHFGKYDIYKLIALWNKEYITTANIEKPDRKDWGPTETDEKYYKNALNIYDMKCRRLKDFVSGKYSNSDMTERYGVDWLRMIGIDIACYDEQNLRLKYPIKITHDEGAIYEECNISISDEYQGWGKYNREYDSDYAYMSYEDLKALYEENNDYYAREQMELNYEDKFNEDFDNKEETL